jgi:hypothetical protein
MLAPARELTVCGELQREQLVARQGRLVRHHGTCSRTLNSMSHTSP